MSSEEKKPPEAPKEIPMVQPSLVKAIEEQIANMNDRLVDLDERIRDLERYKHQHTTR